MRVPQFSVGAAARATGVVAVAGIGIAALLHAARHDDARTLNASTGHASTDPIAAELTRCQNIGMAAQDDQGCLAAWAKNRRRFFGDVPPVIARAHSSDSTTPQQPGR